MKVSKDKKERRASKAHLLKMDPFDVPLEVVHQLRGEEYGMLLDRLDELHGDWIKKKLMETGAQSIVVCDHKVIFTSQNRYEPSDEELLKMEKQIGKPCYVIAGEPLIEERSGWSDLGRGDYYPTLEIYLGKQDWSDQQVFQRGVKLNCDFDTGNPMYTVLDERVCRALLRRPGIPRRSYHLGRRYRFYSRLMKVGVKDAKNERCLSKTVEGVEEWDDVSKNPYKMVNPRREGFIGRDLMLQLLVRITLDPRQHASEWELV